MRTDVARPRMALRRSSFLRPSGLREKSDGQSPNWFLETTRQGGNPMREHASRPWRLAPDSMGMQQDMRVMRKIMGIVCGRDAVLLNTVIIGARTQGKRATEAMFPGMPRRVLPRGRAACDRAGGRDSAARGLGQCARKDTPGYEGGAGAKGNKALYAQRHATLPASRSWARDPARRSRPPTQSRIP